MTIVSATIYRADLPLLTPLSHASAAEEVLEEVFLRVMTRSGVWGLAEVRGNGAYATGADTEAILGELSRHVRPALLGAELEAASDRFAARCTLPLARAAVDMAVHDAIAREADVPLWRVFGAAPRQTTIPTHAQIGFCPPEQALELARKAASAGFMRIKLRVGRPEHLVDVAILRALDETLDESVTLAIDANGAWDAPTAISVVNAVSASRIAWVEQPTPAGDTRALRSVRQATEAPVIADEAVRTASDITRLDEAEALDGVHLKLEKAGTAKELIAQAAHAREAGLLVCLGQMDQGRLGSSVTAHLGAAIEADAYELWGFQNIARDVATGFEVREGAAVVPSGSGTGVSVAQNELNLVEEIA